MSNDLQFMCAEAFYKSVPASWRIFRLWGGAWVEVGIIIAVDTVLPDAGEQAREAKDYWYYCWIFYCTVI